MADGYRLHRPVTALDGPVLIVMLNGWIDASGAAAAALAAVEAECNMEPLATFDSDTYIDYRARRPTMELREGVNTQLVWPSIILRAGRTAGGRDVLTLSGPEPDAQWLRFATEVGDLALELGVSRMVGFGAYPFATPHTRPSRLSISSPSQSIVDALPYLKNSVDVPAGIGALLEQTLHDRRIPTITLWAQVPHYVTSMNYPAASVALLDGLFEVAGISTAAADVRHATTIQRQRLDQLVAGNDEHVTMVHQLEAAYDTVVERGGDQLGTMQIPTGDELAAELERFLREQGD